MKQAPGKSHRPPGGDHMAPRTAFWLALSIWVLTLATAATALIYNHVHPLPPSLGAGQGSVDGDSVSQDRSGVRDAGSQLPAPRVSLHPWAVGVCCGPADWDFCAVLKMLQGRRSRQRGAFAADYAAKALRAVRF